MQLIKTNDHMNVLGIESSCDETSVAIIVNGKLAANLISSQDFHAKYGGVVPELSSRAHLQIIIPLIKDALKKSDLELKDIDLICSTAGPGLIGALLVGLTFAKGLSYSLNKPFIPVLTVVYIAVPLLYVVISHVALGSGFVTFKVNPK